MKKIILICITIFIGTNLLAQENTGKKGNFILNKMTSDNTSRKGKLSISWGYNRSNYAKSTIRFWGDGYDFKIMNAKAIDKPEKSFYVYVNPALLSIPQYNLRVGYFLTDKLSISFNVDHMKYVLDNSQTAIVNGTIDSTINSKWAGNYDNKSMELEQDFILFEHTDGLNYLTGELDYNALLYQTKKQNFSIDLIAGVGIGFVVPKTRALLLDTKGADAFHWAGGGISTQLGFRFYFYKHFFFAPKVKMGYLYMPNIATNGLENDRASQSISFFEKYITVGYQFNLHK